MIRTLAAIFLVTLMAVALEPLVVAETTCDTCHADSMRVADPAGAAAAWFRGDVHREAGLSCHHCHGGDPSAGLDGKTLEEMHPPGPNAPFVVSFERIDSVRLCGTCHSDAAYMARYQPGSRVDQEALFWTSRHGQALRRGNDHSASCSDCHAAHGVRRGDDPESTVHPRRLAPMCGACHSSAEHMAGARNVAGNPIVLDANARWNASVHADALLRKSDLFSPTCNGCHGNHADAPDGLDSVEQACGSCHQREASLMVGSPLARGFEKHVVYMEEAEDDGCAACHEPWEPSSKLPPDSLRDPCIVCHGSHAVAPSSLAMLAPTPEAACSVCHASGGDARGRERVAVVERELIEQGTGEGLSGADLHDWLLDRAAALPQHRPRARAEEGANVASFETLMMKLRIGKTHLTIPSPGQPVERREIVAQCPLCHLASEKVVAAPGLVDPIAMGDRLTALSARAAEAALMLGAARKGGVESRAGARRLEVALQARAELGALIHTFRYDEQTPFAQKFDEGMEQADSARDAGAAALREAAHRRRWLGWALATIGLAALAVVVMIRQTSARSREVEEGS